MTGRKTERSGAASGGGGLPLASFRASRGNYKQPRQTTQSTE